MAVCPKSAWPAVKVMLYSVYDQPDAEAVHAQFDKLLDQLTEKLPEVAEHLDSARADVLAFAAFPKEVWRQIWSITPTSGSTARSAGGPTSWGSSPTATRSPAWSAPYSPNGTTTGPRVAATCPSTS
jgi:putative transposase